MTTRVDPRRDTVTEPSAGVRKAITATMVGDDGYGERPTVCDLDATAATRFGHHGTLCPPTRTMTNQVAIPSNVLRSDELLADADAQIVTDESGAAAAPGGIPTRPRTCQSGLLDVAAVAGHPRDAIPVTVRARAVAVDQTADRAGDLIQPLEPRPRRRSSPTTPASPVIYALDHHLAEFAVDVDDHHGATGSRCVRRQTPPRPNTAPTCPAPHLTLRTVVSPAASQRPTPREVPVTIAMHRTRTGPDRRTLRRGRIAVGLYFAAAGAAIGTWTARLPTIKHNLGVSDGQLSIALLALAVGGLLGMRIGRIVDRYGATTIARPTALALGPLLALLAYAPTLWSVACGLLAFGLVHGTLNVSMNTIAVQCQHAYRRPIMAAFHGMFSIGGMAGAATGGLAAHLHASVAATFAATGGSLLVLAGWATYWTPKLRPAPQPTATSPRTAAQTAVRPLAASVRRRALLLGLVAFCSLIGEGAAADWSSVYLHDNLHSSAATAASAYTAFAASMTLGRLTGDRLVARWRPVALLRGCGLLAGVGLGAGLLAGTAPAAVVGFSCLGAGLSCVVPQIYSSAGNLDPNRAGSGLSRVAALGYLGYVGGPVLIGAVASQTGLAHALLILPVLALLITAGAGTVRVPTSTTHGTVATDSPPAR